MPDKKLTKGTYYSCPHQKLSNNKCNTCNAEQERNQEQETKIKRERCRQLGTKRADIYHPLTDEESQELDQLINWASDNLGEDWSTTPHFSNHIPSDNPQVETTFYSCKNCGQTIVESEGKPGPNESKITVKEDCYLEGDSDYTCAKHKEGKPNNLSAEVQQLKTEVQALEKITSRTAQQEQELKDKKAKLDKLEKSQGQDPNKTDYLPQILGIGGIFIIGIIAYFLLKSRKEKEMN